MFYIKVMNKSDNDYSMFTAVERYRVSRTYSGDCAPQKCEAYIIINENKGDDVIPFMIEVKSVAYIMSDSGKTIDTVYTS
jgi:hypothetical protein